MTSQARIDANRRNAQKSTGPRTAEGKERARFNAVKHGATAQTPVLPDEDPALFLARVDAYKFDLSPQNYLEHELIERMALFSAQFDRAMRVDIARAATNVLTMPDLAERDRKLEAASLGKRLFSDRRGPIDNYPNGQYPHPKLRTSWSEIADDPDDPARLVMLLESTGPGCRWLLDRWAELRARLEQGDCWQSPEKLKAIRLLGRQPLHAADVREVTEIFLACHVIDPLHKDAFFELRCEFTDDEFKGYHKRLHRRNLDAMRPTDPAAARDLLLDLVDRAVDRLKQLEEMHRIQEDQMLPLRAAVVASDDTIEGDRRRRYAMACDRALHRTLASIHKSRKESSQSPPESDQRPERHGQWPPTIFRPERDQPQSRQTAVNPHPERDDLNPAPTADDVPPSDWAHPWSAADCAHPWSTAGDQT